MISGGGAKRIEMLRRVRRRVAFAFQLHICAGARVQIIGVDAYRRGAVARAEELGKLREKIAAKAFDLRAPRALLLALIVERAAARIIEVEIFGRDKAQHPDKIRFEQRHMVQLTKKIVVRQNAVCYILAAKVNSPNPSQMV